MIPLYIHHDSQGAGEQGGRDEIYPGISILKQEIIWQLRGTSETGIEMVLLLGPLV
jgi:hypothetical protein